MPSIAKSYKESGNSVKIDDLFYVNMFHISSPYTSSIFQAPSGVYADDIFLQTMTYLNYIIYLAKI